MKNSIQNNIEILLDQFIRKLPAVFAFLGVAIGLDFFPQNQWLIFDLALFGYFFGAIFGVHWLTERNNHKKN